MRRGYWTGFIMGGLIGMVAAKAYGDRLMDTLFPGVSNSEADGGGEAIPEAYRPRRRRRYRRSI